MFTFNSEKNQELVFDLMYLDIYDEDVMYCMTCQSLTDINIFVSAPLNKKDFKYNQ